MSMPARRKPPVMRRGYTRRGFLEATAKAGAAGAVISSVPVAALKPRPAAADPVLPAERRRTLDAALARMIPADGPDDWSAADVGVGDYIERILAGEGDIYAGGPVREDFDDFRPLSRVKEMGWAEETERLRALYEEGFTELDRRAGGSFADASVAIQDLVLTTLDLEGSPFFAALYEHTMEGAYAHPVYGGNTGYRTWSDLCYQGDVHGVRFPTEGSAGAWNIYGGYSPEEMIEPGTCPGQGPVT
jgi:gluconate 2-dehydrogenase gamma chain